MVSVTLKFILKIKYFVNFLLSIVVIPIAIIIILIKPIIFLRFGILPYKRIGHLTIDVAIYFSKIQKLKSKKAFDIIGYSSNKSCNKKLIKVWSEKFFILNSTFIIEIIKNSLELLTRSEVFTIKLHGLDKDRNYIEGEYITFTEEEINYCNYILKKLNIPLDKKWICIHNRDDEYMNAKFKIGSIVNKKQSIRNFAVEDLVSCSFELTKSDYYVIRIGSIQKSILKSNNDKIIDYSHCNYKSDLLDIFLLSKCYFYLGSDSGIANVAVISNKYIGFINQTHFINFSFFVRNRICIYKKFYSKKLKRPLSIKEIFKKRLHTLTYIDEIQSADIELIDNTNNEINELSKEILSRLNNTWKYTEEEEALHKKFKNLLKEIFSEGKNLANCSSEIIDYENMIMGNFYLKNNLYLLD
jgi:putative glycosyltransferase (TIGR04372 family)